jgi:hypothetical protein
MEILLADGTVYPVQRFVGTVPVEQTVGEIFNWLVQRGKLESSDPSHYQYQNENGQV